jgi:hypothetical protein
LADLVRPDRHNHRPIAGDSELAEAVKVLARPHQSLVWTRQRQLNQLRSLLGEFYPGRWPSSVATWAVATPWPCSRWRRPDPGPGAVAGKLAATLRRAGRQRGVDGRAAELRAVLRQPQLEPSPVVAEAYGAAVTALVG